MYHNVVYTLIALEQAIKEPEALNDEDKKYLKSLQSALLHLNFAELKLKKFYEYEKENHRDSTLNRNLSGMSKENPEWNGADNRDFIGRHLLDAFYCLSMEYCHKEFKAILEKELMVTSGVVIKNIQKEHKKQRNINSSIGGLASKNRKIKLKNYIKEEVINYLSPILVDSSETIFTRKEIANRIEKNITNLIKSDPDLIVQYKDSGNELIKNYISELIKDGELNKNWFKDSNSTRTKNVRNR
ncbi:TPA: hypothetical protein SMT94_002351 [Proteus mirabilis]